MEQHKKALGTASKVGGGPASKVPARACEGTGDCLAVGRPHACSSSANGWLAVVCLGASSLSTVCRNCQHCIQTHEGRRPCCLQMLAEPKADRVEAWCYKAMALVCMQNWDLAIQVDSGTHCPHGLLPDLPASAQTMCSAQQFQDTCCCQRPLPCWAEHATLTPEHGIGQVSTDACPTSTSPCSDLSSKLVLEACPQTCRIASTIQNDDPCATQLLDFTRLTKLTIELMVSQAARDKIWQEITKRRTAEAISKPEAVKTSPVSAAGGLEGDGLAAEELQQAVGNPIRGPGMDTIQQVRWHSGTHCWLGASCLPPYILLWPVMHTSVQGHQLQGLKAAEACSIDAVLSQRCWDPFS